jgi:hypothetical protein
LESNPEAPTMLFVKFLLLTILPFSVAVQQEPAGSHTAEFSVLVLDALNGKPQAGFSVSNFCPGEGVHQLDSSVVTDQNGIAKIRFTCVKNDSIELMVTRPNTKSAYEKEQCGGGAPLTIEQVLKSGYITDPTAAGNIWCPAKISKKLKPVPGQVTVFVKKPTWWQVHFAG